MIDKEAYHHRRLECGVEVAALCLPGRRTTTYEIRVLSGLVHEPEDKLGLAKLVEETISKGTAKRTAQEVSDAFDAIGASNSSAVGRESFVFRCSSLPEYVEDAMRLHAELLRTPTFPQDYCDVAIDLMNQELTALEDEPGELARKALAPHAYGPVLGRHELGSRETLARITRDDVVAFWTEQFAASRMIVAVAGAVDFERCCDTVESLFDNFGGKAADGRQETPITMSPGTYHHHKELEQQHILMCWPGGRVTDDDYAAERITLTVLSGGMSSRLFTEVREKQGLVYWVGAWDEHPRGAGRVFMGASTTPARCDKTVDALLREVDRLADDVTEEELQRAKIGIIAKTQTHGEITRSRTSELSSDVFHYGRPIPTEEKNSRIEAVSIEDVKRYLAAHPRDSRCLLTLGPRDLAGNKN